MEDSRHSRRPGLAPGRGRSRASPRAGTGGEGLPAGPRKGQTYSGTMPGTPIGSANESRPGAMSEPLNNAASALRQEWQPRLALLVAATFFMEFLDGTVLTTAIPSIAGDFACGAGGRQHHHDGLPHDGGHGHSGQRVAGRTGGRPSCLLRRRYRRVHHCLAFVRTEPGPHHAHRQPRPAGRGRRHDGAGRARSWFCAGPPRKTCCVLRPTWCGRACWRRSLRRWWAER